MIPTFAIQGTRRPRLPSREGLSGWTEDLARSMNSNDMAKMSQALGDSLDSVAKAYDALNQVESDLNELGQRTSDLEATFGAPDPQDPESPASIAYEPLQVAEAHIRVGGRRLAGIDILFYELSLVYTDIGNTFDRAGFTSEAGSARMTAQAMRDWRSAVDSRIYSRLPTAFDARAALDDAFKAALAARGLQPVLDNDKPGYFEALAEVLAPLGDEELPGEASLQGAFLGADPVTIGLLVAAIVKIVIIGAVIIAALLIINKIVQNVFGAGTEAMKAATELQQRKTLREQQVAAGTLSRTEADQLNAKDSESFKNDVNAAAVAAAKAGPSATDLLVWVGIPVAGLAATFGILKLSHVI